MESEVGWSEWPVPRQPWDVRRAWASIFEGRRDVWWEEEDVGWGLELLVLEGCIFFCYLEVHNLSVSRDISWQRTVQYSPQLPLLPMHLPR